MSTQDIRHSQFVITYGPGAILEGQRGPVAILASGHGLFTDDFGPERLEIVNRRMSQGLLGGRRIFRPPSGSEGFIWKTKPFPGWALCIDHWILYRLRDGCPRCQGQRTRKQAIRFIRACAAGHMDDVDWYFLVHGPRQCHRGDSKEWYEWVGGGGSLADLRVRCPVCGSEGNLGQAYSRGWPCSARFPEREPPNAGADRHPGDCQYQARIIQRQASNLRVVDLQTLFIIPPRHTRLHHLLEQPPIPDILIADGGIPNPAEFRRKVANLAQFKRVSDAVVEGLSDYTDSEIVQAAGEVLAPPPATVRELLVEEFRALIEGSTHGVYAPAGSRVMFEIPKDGVQRIPTPGGRGFRVAPVSRLNTVTVQMGYRRLVEPNPADCRLVSVAYRDRLGQEWLPGVEYPGEGIFITLDDGDSHFPLAGSDVAGWAQARASLNSYPPGLFRAGGRDELHPVFVWWHTLSHLLIRAVALHSGYGAASIRERVYLEVEDQRVRGGIILYASQPGGDGALGGLIALVPHFTTVLHAALNGLHFCSNGHFCDETRYTPGAHGGASCYGCTVISETSCEHRNMWLDRRVLLSNLP